MTRGSRRRVRPVGRQRILVWILSSLMVCAALALQSATASQARSRERPRTVTISVTSGHPTNRFIPSHAFGAGVDGHDKGEADRQLRPENIEAMLSAGLKSLTYRLRTELAIDAWHWNPHGNWSDPGHKRGYWISDSTPREPIFASYGYRLPRRGNTIDQASNDGYSRLDDGDPKSFWKSNPYLDRYFTHEDNSLHPQWIVIEFGTGKMINAVRLFWGVPFAANYQIQYASFDDVSDIALNSPAMWKSFPRGVIQNSAGGDVFLRLSSVPVKARFVRILLTKPSGTAPSGSFDIRDRLGYAMRELQLGLVDDKGEFHDQISHTTDRHTQTIIHVSSTDPWHREADLDEGVEQPGFDRIFRSGLTNGLPMLTPAGLCYDTPENAANEVRYLRARGYNFERLELGEEPDGQYVTPEDFGALYLQWSDAIHKVDPNLNLGGPSFQEIQPDTSDRQVKLDNSAWMRRFLNYLQARDRLSEYAFFSFEWYPFDDVCESAPRQLARAADLLKAALREMERGGVSHRIPWIISEYGYSALATRAELSIEGALLNADIVGLFLTLGGDQACLYGYTPSQVFRDRPCTVGNNMLFSMDDDGNITHRFATYFGARLLTREWVKPSDEWHEIYPAAADVRNSKGEPLVTAYAVHRPDGLWSLLLINKNPARSYKVEVSFLNEANGAVSAFTGPVDLFQFSSAQYELNDDPKNPYPIKADPPAHTVIQASPASFELPGYSLTVIRGMGPQAQ